MQVDISNYSSLRTYAEYAQVRIDELVEARHGRLWQQNLWWVTTPDQDSVVFMLIDGRAHLTAFSDSFSAWHFISRVPALKGMLAKQVSYAFVKPVDSN